jgi:hypothetical protein
MDLQTPVNTIVYDWSVCSHVIFVYIEKDMAVNVGGLYVYVVTGGMCLMSYA